MSPSYTEKFIKTVVHKLNFHNIEIGEDAFYLECGGGLMSE
jgi:hypothetical protein